MDVVRMYDYYFLDEPHRTIESGCEFTLCANSTLVKRLRQVERGAGAADVSDVLGYMLYNASSDTGVPAHYSCCMSSEGGHVCNTLPIMIGSRLEEKLMSTLGRLLAVDSMEAAGLYDRTYLHRVYTGAFLINGTLYYSVFRESNNNKICHNSKSKGTGDQTVVYMYDRLCNRGIKMYTDASGYLMINGRDGNHVPEVTPDVLRHVYQECMERPDLYSTDVALVTGMFVDTKSEGMGNIDRFKNKMYTNYTIGLNTFLNKIPVAYLTNPVFVSNIMGGRINLGISQAIKYSASKSDAKKQNEQKLKMCTGLTSDYLIDSQRRRNNRRPNETESASTSHPGVVCAPSSAAKSASPGQVGDAPTVAENILGSRNVKGHSFIKRMEHGDQMSPSIFNQISPSYLPYILVLSSTVQKLQVENVHAETSKTISQDAFGFICMKYMGNIGTAGKNMLFTTRAVVSYGHTRRAVSRVEEYLMGAGHGRFDWLTATTETDVDNTVATSHYYVVLNNGLTRYRIRRTHLHSFMVRLKRECDRFVWVKLVGGYVQVYVYEGMPFMRFDANDAMYAILAELVDLDTRRSYMYGPDQSSASSSSSSDLLLCRTEIESLCDSMLRTGFLAEPAVGVTVKRMYAALMDDERNEYDNAYPLATLGYTVTTDGLIDVRCRHDLLPRHQRLACNAFVNFTNAFILFGTRAAGELAEHPKAVADTEDGGDEDSQEVDSDERNDRDTGGPVNETHRLDTLAAVVSLESHSVESQLAAQMNQYTNYTAPAKRSVSVNARKSSCINVYYQKAADLIHGFAIFVDPDEYERRLADRLAREQGVPTDRTLAEFASMRGDARNCPGDQSDPMLRNFYMMKTVFADIAGFNVEDANVIDASTDLCMSFSYRFSLSFTDRTKRGVNVNVVHGDPCRSSVVCQFDDAGAPTAVLFLVCVIDARCARNHETELHFPPFRKMLVSRDSDNCYYVYFVRNDAVLLKAIAKETEKSRLDRRHREHSLYKSIGGACGRAAAAYGYVCHDDSDYRLPTGSVCTRVTRFNADNGERIVNIETLVHGHVDNYDGVKVINSFGQKGLAVIKDLRPYFRPPQRPGVPVQLVMNNCSFVSRQPIGQLLQMRRNGYETVYSASGEPTACGFSAVFFNENEPTVTTCLVRLDEMMRSVLITACLPVFQNLKSCTDNVYNQRGLMLSPQVRQILGLYRCAGVAYRVDGDDERYYARRDEVQRLIDIFDEYMVDMRNKRRVSNLTNQMTMNRLPETLADTSTVDYLRSIKRLTSHTDGTDRSVTMTVNLLEDRSNVRDDRYDVHRLRYYDETGRLCLYVVLGNPCLIEQYVAECKMYEKYVGDDLSTTPAAYNDESYVTPVSPSSFVAYEDGDYRPVSPDYDPQSNDVP